MRYRVQHGTDSIAVCDVKGAPDVEAKVVKWRLYPGGSKMVDCGDNGFNNQFNRVLKDGRPYFIRHERQAGRGFYDIALAPQLDTVTLHRLVLVFHGGECVLNEEV